ncbi:Cleavage stimulation factor subunit 3 [Lamellibrachia satsuma]|nr:Cleavage stimulation factor subunit 3 [Lamellibrachia satsuma]
MSLLATPLATELPREDMGYIPNKLVKAEKRIAAYPYDTEAWSALIRDAQTKRVEDARPVYERVVSQFPNAGRYWKLYIEHEMKSQNYEKVEKLFQRCLMKVLSIDLWKTYLQYIKQTKASLPTFREKMAHAYDFALDKMGMDIMSYPLWNDYVNFLKSVEAVGSYAENQRITAVRKVYQRGVINPMINIEAFWKDYCNFENNINPLIAKKMQEDRGRDYMNARRVGKEYEVVTKGLNRNAASVPPQNIPDEVKQVDLWKKYITWEKSNPLRTEDPALITKRVMFAYEQCLLCLGHHPDIWIEAATFLEQASKLLTEKGDQNTGKLFADEAAAMYERAITTILKANMLNHFAYADFEEGRMKYEKVHSIYKKLIAITETDPTLTYIHYMAFARRAEGIKSARLVFKAAREDARSKYHVFIYASLMEYYCSKDKAVAFKIFELGMKRYGQHEEYMLAYIDFMAHINEDNNTRVLFERILSSGQLPPEKTYEIWSKFLEFESTVGDLASTLKVEKRRAQVLAKEFEGKETALLIDRYRYFDLMPCSSTELKALGYKDISGKYSVGPTLSESDESLPKDNSKPKQPKYPMPDISQMLPFKPRIVVPTGAHPIPGGVFPPPPAASELMTKLPPPDCFVGPFVQIDKFVEHLKYLTLTSDTQRSENGTERVIDPGTAFSIDIAMGRKRKIHQMATTTNDDSDDDDNVVPPANDLYRSRQQKKVK